MSNISAGQVSMIAFRIRLLLAAICKATTNESNHRAHRVHRGRTETSYPEYCGTFDSSPILNHVTIS